MQDHHRPPLWQIQSAVAGISWPAVPSPGAASALAILHQIEQTQWLSHDEIVVRQLQQLAGLLKHAFDTVPWYRKHWAGLYRHDRPLTFDEFARLPLLDRRTLQASFDDLKSARTPKAHGAVKENRTSGSTAAPVRFLTNQMAGLYWNVFTLRDHLWHRRDLSCTLGVIRREAKLGRAANWGPATAGLVKTGACVSNSIQSDAGALLDWLCKEQPQYLFTYPSLLRELASLSIAQNLRPAGLREVRTLAESVSTETREMVRTAWGVPLTDLYSASEPGYIALQCPQHDHLHVMSEGVLVEVLDGNGTQCAPGQVGRVVVTPLHNFAMPLVRYDIGDYAEVGSPCPCGRGLPVLKRVLGRVRNTLITADGKRYWPAFGTRSLMEVAPVQQYQFIQTSHSQIEARVVASPRLSPAQERAFCARVASQLPAGIKVNLIYCDEIPRSASGKFEEFISHVGG